MIALIPTRALLNVKMKFVNFLKQVPAGKETTVFTLMVIFY